jgi:outer membrane protein TolC
MEKTRLTHEIIAFKDKNYSEYKKHCDTYRATKKMKQMIIDSISKFKKRQELEEKRFHLGRTEASRVIYAMKDLINAEFARAKVEKILSVSYWKILKSLGKVNEEINYLK